MVDTKQFIKNRFEELGVSKKNWIFLLSSSNLKSLDDVELRKCCIKFAKTFSKKIQSLKKNVFDVGSNDLLFRIKNVANGLTR
jgi:hypothetical protein